MVIETFERPSTTRAKKTVQRVFRHENSVLVGILLVIIAIMAVVTKGKTVSPLNVSNVLLQSAIKGVSSIGQFFVILTAGIDISVGGLASMVNMLGASFITAELTQNVLGAPLAVGAAIPIMLAMGAGIGALNGLSVSRLGMPPLIVTLAMWQISRGIAYQATAGRPIGDIPDSMAFLGQGSIAGIPTPIFIFIVVVILAYFVLHYTTFGRNVYSVGGNPVSSWLCGVKVKDVLLKVYIISGFLAGLAGVMTMSRTMSGSMLAFKGFELDTIAAVVVGGVSLFGGRGNMIGVVIGIILLGVVTNGMVVMGVGPEFQDLVRGGIVFGAVAADTLRRR